jgi:pimeloyl-ACP methyl ester carboxylesterase
VDLGDGVTIHVADAGPADGPAVMLVHGFPENWWEWHELIGPLAVDGYRVLCPDLRGAGWSSAPRSRYLKNEMADDLAAVLDRLGVESVKLVAHDWGGPVAFIMMLRHPAKVTGFFGLNTSAPWVRRDLGMIRHMWRFWYQIPMSLPVIGPRLIADPKARYFRMLASWVGGGYSVPDEDVRMYVERMRQPGHAVAGSRSYRSFQTTEMLRWMRGEFDGARRRPGPLAARHRRSGDNAEPAARVWRPCKGFPGRTGRRRWPLDRRAVTRPGIGPAPSFPAHRNLNCGGTFRRVVAVV